MKFKMLMIAGALLLMGARTAKAGVEVLTFQGLGDEEAVDNYYNGGLGGSGSGPGPNYGITFTSDSLAIISEDNGGSGNFINETEGGETCNGACPGGDTILFFLEGAGDTMNVAAGFTTGFSFDYTSTTNAGSVTVWSGENGTGTELASLSLAALGSCAGPNYCNWAEQGVAFSGTAESVIFSGVADYIGFDDITLGSATAGGGTSTPESSTLLSLGVGLIGLLAFGRRKAAGLVAAA